MPHSISVDHYTLLQCWPYAAWQLETRSDHPDEAGEPRDRNEEQGSVTQEIQSAQRSDDAENHTEHTEPSGKQPHGHRRDGKACNQQTERHAIPRATDGEDQEVQRAGECAVVRDPRLRYGPLNECGQCDSTRSCHTAEEGDQDPGRLCTMITEATHHHGGENTQGNR